jgi:indolepyruvate ferredoxin oxidoreductase beta subunit
MTERIAPGDGRVDAGALLAGARAAARRLVAHDYGALAERHRSPIGAVLFGAIAASGALPFTREQYEATIRRSGVGGAASLDAFTAGWAAASGEATDGAGGDASAAAPPPRLGPRLAALGARIDAEFAAAARATLRHAVVRLADYQDVAYASEYLDRLAPLRACGDALLEETARHLALWMSYEDAVRVADLKTRASRFERVAAEVRLAPGQQLAIGEYLHPRTEEIADVLPAGLGRWLLATRWARAGVDRLCRRGRVVTTSSLRGYLLLAAVASLRRWRRRSLRHATEHARIDAWLADIGRLATAQPALALEVARLQRLVKGYGDTHARGWARYERLRSELPMLAQQPDGARRLNELARAALADEDGAALEQRLATA